MGCSVDLEIQTSSQPNFKLTQAMFRHIILCKKKNEKKGPFSFGVIVTNSCLALELPDAYIPFLTLQINCCLGPIESLLRKSDIASFQLAPHLLQHFC